MSDWWASWNYNQFSYNAYNEMESPNNWCVKKGDIYVNPNTTIKYFRKNCLDPYTAYNFWYRRFADQKQYLNCYWIPYADKELDAQWGYIQPGKQCKQSYRTRSYNVTDGGFHYYDSVPRKW